MKLGWKRNLAASVLLVAIIVTGALFFTNNSSVSQVTQSGPLTVSFKFFDNDIASKIAYITFAFPSGDTLMYTPYTFEELDSLQDVGAFKERSIILDCICLPAE